MSINFTLIVSAPEGGQIMTIELGNWSELRELVTTREADGCFPQSGREIVSAETIATLVKFDGGYYTWQLAVCSIGLLEEMGMQGSIFTLAWC